MVALPRSFAAEPMVNAATSGKTAKIVSHRRFSLEAMRAEYRAVCADLIKRAYPAPSPNACAASAGERMGQDPATFYRILRLETRVPDFTLVAAAVALSGRDIDAFSAFALSLEIACASTKPAPTPTSGLARPCVNSPGAGAPIRKNNNNGV
jgi:hypothetical protein